MGGRGKGKGNEGRGQRVHLVTVCRPTLRATASGRKSTAFTASVPVRLSPIDTDGLTKMACLGHGTVSGSLTMAYSVVKMNQKPPDKI